MIIARIWKFILTAVWCAVLGALLLTMFYAAYMAGKTDPNNCTTATTIQQEITI